MELFIPNIPKIVSLGELRGALRDELHRPAYSPLEPLNFHVRIFNDTNGRSRGMGILALPSRDVGMRFLRESSRRQIRVGNGVLAFRESNQPPDRTIQERIQRPYTDIQEATDQQERQTSLLREEKIRLDRLQFGWQCRDGKFSNEWEYQRDKSGWSETKLCFLPDSRQIQISTVTFDEIEYPRFEDISITHEVVIAYSSIDWVSAHICQDDGAPVILIRCHTPPAFYHTYSPIDWLGQPLRMRNSALNIKDTANQRPHSEVNRYCSHFIRLVCVSRDGPAHFKDLLQQAQLRLDVKQDSFPITQANVWSETRLSIFRSWRDGLPFFYAYLVESLLRSLAVDPVELMSLKDELEALIESGKAGGLKGQEYVAMVLRDFERSAQALFGTTEQDLSLSACFQAVNKRYINVSTPTVITKRNDDGIFLCLHVIITPTTILYEGPFPERSNRVIRSFAPQHHMNFIRVTFVDEGKLAYHHSPEYSFERWVRQRVGQYLARVFQIAGRPFRFLAYSQSSLKNHSVWFLRSFKRDGNGPTIDVPYIINSLGTFDGELMRCPARYAARISQGFTTTDPTTTEVADLRIIEDITRVEPHTGTEWNFTDGVGTMSPEFAQSLHYERLRRKRGSRVFDDDYPRALQIRFLGSKGVLSVDHTLTGRTVCLRKSMIKFTGVKSKRIELAQVFDKPGNFYLNRPLIMILEGLGVPYRVFEQYQNTSIENIQQSTSSLGGAVHFLSSMGLGSAYRLPSVLPRLRTLGASTLDDPFYQVAMHYARNDALREMKHKSRIPIPGAFNLVGVADIHGYLREGEIFVCIQVDGQTKYFEGPTLVSRAPCIHPGDVQIAQAIGRPPLGSCFEKEQLPNTLVFSTHGTRPLQSYLGGGDLDGDEYAVISLAEHPGLTIAPTDPSPYAPAVRRLLGRTCTQADIAAFVADFIIADNLGQIALTWRILADSSPDGIFDKDCLKLADMHSHAVDFPKSGTAVPVKEIPRRPKLLPDWYAPETMQELDTEKYYKSQRAIGRLFRAVDLPATETVLDAARRQRMQMINQPERISPFETSNLPETGATSGLSSVIWPLVNRRLDADSREWSREALHALFLHYRSRLQTICSLHTILHRRGAMLTEEEVFVGTIVANTTQPTRRLDHIAKVREETTVLVNDIREALFDRSAHKRLADVFMAWYKAFSENTVFGARSFAWIALGVCLETMDEIDSEVAEERRRHETESAPHS